MSQFLKLLKFASLLLFAQAQVTSTIPNCFDYTATKYDTEVYNDLGFTSAMTLRPYKSCQVDIGTGIARFVYESGLTVQMYAYNSLQQPIRLGGITSGQIVYWYGFDGKAANRKFLLINPTKYPVSFRITVQTVKGLLDTGVQNAITTLALLGLLGIMFLF